MSWRTVIISSTAKLDYQMGYLVIRKDDVTKIHLSEIETVMIESTSVSLTATLLCELTKKKIKVIFCDEKRNPSSELISYYGAHAIVENIRKNKPADGLVQVLKITEKQFGKMEFIVGTKKSEILDTDERVVII